MTMDGTLSGFLGDSKGGNFADWRPDGKITFFLHPQCFFGKRTQIHVPGTKLDDDEKLILWTRRRFHHGDEDSAAVLLAWLKNDTPDIDAHDVVLRVKAGKVVEEYRKGDLLGLDKFDWRRNPLNPRTEYLFAMVRAKNPKMGEILTLPFTAGRKISRLIDEEIAELGEQEGNPLETPWAIQVSYDEKASGADMYSVRRSNLKLTDEVEAIFAKEPEDVKQFTDVSREDLSEGTTAQLLAKVCVVPCPVLDVDREQEVVDDSEPEPEPTTKPSVRSQQLKSTTTKSILTTKSSSKPQPSGDDAVEVRDCQVGISYDHEGETLVYSGKKDGRKKKVVFFDEDDCKVSLEFGTMVLPISKGEEAPATDDVGEVEVEQEEQPLTVRDLEPDDRHQLFYDGSGAKLKFIRYNDSREKGVFTDEGGERVFLGADALISRDGADEVGDELEPRTTEKDEPESEEPEATDSDDSDTVETFKCPCGQIVKATDPVCPECGSEFEPEDEDTPFDED